MPIFRSRNTISLKNCHLHMYIKCTYSQALVDILMYKLNMPHWDPRNMRIGVYRESGGAGVDGETPKTLAIWRGIFLASYHISFPGGPFGYLQWLVRCSWEYFITKRHLSTVVLGALSKYLLGWGDKATGEDRHWFLYQTLLWALASFIWFYNQQWHYSFKKLLEHCISCLWLL